MKYLVLFLIGLLFYFVMSLIFDCILPLFRKY